MSAHHERPNLTPSRPPGPEDLASPHFAIHIDLKVNGDILVSFDGREYRLLTLDQLRRKLQDIKRDELRTGGKYILYTREGADQEPSGPHGEAIAVIQGCQLPVKLMGLPVSRLASW
jgi:hypothetical protein